MQKTSFAILCVLIAAASGVPSYSGLANHVQLQSLVGFAIFMVSFISLFAGLYVTTERTEDFWFCHFLESLGSFRLLNKMGFEVRPYVEGSVLFGLFMNALFHYSEYFSGAGSYMYTSITSAVWYFLLEVLIMASVARYGIGFTEIGKVAELCENNAARDRYLKNVGDAEKFISGRWSLLVFLAGAILSSAIFLYINLQDNLYERAEFYITRPYNGTLLNVFVLEPPDVMGLISWHVVTAIVSGLLAVGGVMAIITLQFLTKISSASVTNQMRLDPFNPLPIRKVTDTLTSFWFMTSSGLLILPLLPLIATSLRTASRGAFAELNSLTVYYYPIFLVSFFIMSSYYVKKFISTLKTKTEKQIYAAAESSKVYPERVKDLTLELFLVDRVPEGPAGGTFMQLFQVAVTVGLALLNLLPR